MCKRHIVSIPQTDPPSGQFWLDVDRSASAEVTSEQNGCPCRVFVWRDACYLEHYFDLMMSAFLFGRGGTMSRLLVFRSKVIYAAHFCLFFMVVICSAQESKVMGEVRFEGATKVEKDSGVWVDGNYVGFLKELHGNKKVMLLPGEHEISVRQSGYDDFLRKIVVEPGQVQTVQVAAMHLSPRATTPDVTATLKLSVEPGRAAVFLDDKYVGHASEFGGLHSMLISPGRHRIKVGLPGYRTFETEVNLLAGQKSEVKTELVKGSIQQASPEIKEPK